MSDTDEMVRLMGHAADLLEASRKTEAASISRSIVAASAFAEATLRMVAASVTPAGGAEPTGTGLPKATVGDLDGLRRRVIAARADRGQSMAAVGRAVGLSTAALSRFENGGGIGGKVALTLLRWLDEQEES